MSVPLTELVLAAQRLDAAAFEKAHPYAALVFPSGFAASPPGASADETGEFKTTSHVRVSPGVRDEPEPLLPSNAVAIFLKKRSAWTPFEDVITLGRATIQDVCLPLASVSKFHVCLERTDNGWKVRDERTLNGTFIDAVRLPPGGSARIQDGTRISFGPEAHALFYTPPALFRYLTALR